ncbi:MAG TPA: nucleoside triphosphate pyrophosphatase [Gammaproteobacteria bacterium]|jgi:septum formation protein|nr:nucleoside triphosphate pyrophosphatase [Gammaproteobacteria bacterium]
MDPQLYLASASPRRKQLLEQLGLRFEVVVADMDERLRPGEAAEDYVSRVAAAKAQAVVRRLGSPSLPVLAADTAVVLGGIILGKPKDRADGIAMLDRLAGRSHQVLSTVALWHSGGMRMAVSRSRVTFRTISPEEAAVYWASGEPADKAGGYGIQGLGGVFVESLDGSYSGVMGLPLFETAALLKDAGIHVL